MRKVLVLLGILGFLTLSAQADPTFYSTSNPAAWQLAVNYGGTDGKLASFQNTVFMPAVYETNRSAAEGVDWIAMNPSGTSGCLGCWAFMVFRQTFDLSGYDLAKPVILQFQWAADDNGNPYAIAGSWVPRFSLNGRAFEYYPGASDGNPVNTYRYSSTVTVSNGFVAGNNTIDFYVEGNGVTDGFALKTISFTATQASTPTVPEPAAALLLGSGLLGLAGLGKKLS